MLLQVTNSRTSIIGADSFILNVLDGELRYSTPVVDVKDLGIDLPGVPENWDGWCCFLHVPKTMYPWFPTGLLARVRRLCEKMGYVVHIEDARVRPKGDVPEIADIPLRDYQRTAVGRALKIGYGVLDLPPRSGKTRLMCEIVRRLALPTLWIAPTYQIVKQTVDVLAGWLGPKYAVQQVGSADIEIAMHRRIVVCTAATAVNLDSEFFKTRECVVVDEMHHMAAPTYRKIFNHCDHVYHRYGLTGTFFRSGDDDLAMHALLSNVIYKVTSLDLLNWGYLVPVHVVFLPVVAKKIRGVQNRFHGGHGTAGIHGNAERNALVAMTVKMLYQTGRKVVVLVGTKKQGYALKSILGESLPTSPNRAQFDTCEFVSTDKPREKQRQILNSFDNGEEVKVLLGTTIIGEGIDLPTADALVLARGERAEVALTQAMYRISTAIPGKDHAVLVDFADRHHRKLLEHSQERLRVYYNEPIFTVQILPDCESFLNWVNFKLPNFDVSAS